jgi:A/G-specific adenine glycosylase
MDAYPSVAECAAAPLGDVLRVWHGLGYPRRARNLHLTAIEVVARHGAEMPSTLPELLALPGIGPYTARAVLAFAFERDVALVDTNIARVHARHAGRRLRGGEVQAVADASLTVGESWAFNQAVMDLGATLCRPRTARCDECPLAVRCVWHAAGGPDPAEGSAGVSGRQPRFEGSDRQARGRLLAALRDGGADAAGAAAAMRLTGDPARAARLVETLVADGLVVRAGGHLALP